MPSLSYDGKSFTLGGRRLWIMGAALQYSLLPREEWPAILAHLRQSGFNTIRSAAPWLLHEPRPGRFDFTGALDLRAFLSLCHEQGLMVILRIGPGIGGTWDGGGLPAWLGDDPGMRVREPNSSFMTRVSAWYSEVLSQAKGQELASVGGAKGGGGGPLLAVQLEDGWNCGNQAAGQAYLRDLRRLARESGVQVPTITSNGLWVSDPGSVETWEGSSDLFVTVRQLQAVHPESPRVVELVDPAAHRPAAARSGRGSRPRGVSSASAPGSELLRRAAQVIAAGGQVIVGEAAPEIHRNPPSAGVGDAPAPADSVVPRLVDQRGRGRESLPWIRRLATFASHFGAVLAEANTGIQPVIPDLERLAAGQVGNVSLESDAGSVAFVFRGVSDPGDDAPITLISRQGARMDVHLGDAPVGWFLFECDLQGHGRLEYCTLSPFALIERKLLVVHGPPATRATLSISGSELELETPAASAGAKPTVVAHAGIVVVACTQAQIDAALIYGRELLIGVSRILPSGEVELAPGFKEAIRVGKNGQIVPISGARAEARLGAGAESAERRMGGGASGAGGRGSRARSGAALAGPWKSAAAESLVQGESEQFATLATPASLSACGARHGYGWYRLRLPSSAKESAIWLPGAVGVMRAWIDGVPSGVFGPGGASRLPLTIPAGSSTLVLLAASPARPARALASSAPAGVNGEAVAVAPVDTLVSTGAAPIFDAFARRAFIPDFPTSVVEPAISLSFQIRRAAPLFLVPGSDFFGAILLNGQLVDVVDVGSAAIGGVTLDPEGIPGWKSGSSTLTLVPFRAVSDLAARVRLFEALEGAEPRRRSSADSKAAARARRNPPPAAEASAAWAFARWQAPDESDAAWVPTATSSKSASGTPRWHACVLRGDADAGAISLDGLSRGIVTMGDFIVGRFDTRVDEKLLLPARTERHDARVLIFDEEGATPQRSRFLPRE